jgi:hypothetical protein
LRTRLAGRIPCWAPSFLRKSLPPGFFLPLPGSTAWTFALADLRKAFMLGMLPDQSAR